MMKRVLFVHHSADMYGADKVLLSLVTGLDKAEFLPIVVVPMDGPLVAALISAGIEVHVIPLVKVGRATMNVRELFKLPLQVIRSLHAIDSVLSGRQVDIVHSNTLAVLSGAVWAWRKKKPHVWHVHEIILRPRLVRKVYGWLLRLFATRIICVSEAVKLFVLGEQPSLLNKTIVVWNGIERDVPVNLSLVNTLHEEIGLRSDECLVTLVGRINRWKGQGLLVEAAGILQQRGVDNVRYLIVGGPPGGQEHFLTNLMAQIEASTARQQIVVLPFTADVWPIWDASDVVIIPSIEPEPFGMVALEAMHARKPVVAANHGGLSEIVVDGETGLLVEPGNAEELAAAILRLVRNEQERIQFGDRGYERVQDLFSMKAQISNLCKIYDSL